jgi:hypothetical protein
MSTLKKILALTFIAIFLSSIPLALAQSQPEYTKVVFTLRADDAAARGSGASGGKVNPGYALTGEKWRVLPVNIIVDSTASLPSVDIRAAIEEGANAWDSQTSKDIFGAATTGAASVADEGSAPDRRNEIVFGAFPDDENDIIAQTTYWYNVRKELVDFDIVFNTYYKWGNVTVDGTSVMDFLNIATHELGHGFGLDDLYDAKWNTQTMYGYASSGETMKRTLESGDIAGIQAIYGR